VKTDDRGLVRERPVIFGGDVELVGVVGGPSGTPSVTARPACVFLNAGLVHRVGPNRMNVRVGRRLAEAGYQTLRFDFSGRGDSDVRRDSLSFMETSVTETAAAMDLMQTTRNCSQFVLIGLCSGAVNAFQVAIADPRVVGAVLIDGPAYTTPGYYARYYLRRLANLDSWRNTLAGRNELGRRLRGRVPPRGRPLEDDFVNPLRDTNAMPPKAEIAATLKRVLDRGARFLFVFSASARTYNYRNQFRDAFPTLMERGAISIEYFPNADHTFTRLHNQVRLEDAVTRWVTATWPEANQLQPAVPAELTP
jgi:pimeloyl-ACP methyl ester carboxylesterase